MSAATVELFGIRHHGPGSARSVARALDELAPDVVLLEAPGDLDGVLVLAADPEMRLPVALTGYDPAAPGRAVFYPLAEFSPEWVALRWALAAGVSVRGIDLPLRFALACPGAPDAGVSLDPIAVLAAAAGDDDPERWWEDTVEHRGGGRETFAAIAEAIGAVRGDRSVEAHEALREASMRQGVRRALGAGAQRVAVVCGAWHVPALGGAMRGGPAEARRDAAMLRGLPSVKVAVTWIPWSEPRLAAASGYRAGVASPGWYAHVHRHPGREGIPRWFAEVAAMLRAEDHAVSPDHLVAATRLAEALAVLRARPQPGLAEVTDAAEATIGNGRPGPLVLIRERLVVGSKVGSVPSQAPTVPLVSDLLATARRLRLKREATPRTIELDLRTPLGLPRSVLFHRLAAVGIDWARETESRASTGTFRETWTMCWQPEVEIDLIEASVHGPTIEQAATALLVERAATASAAELTEAVERALLADLPGALDPLLTRVAHVAATEADTMMLLDMLGPLARIARYGDVRSTDLDDLGAVIDGLVVRICTGVAELAERPAGNLDDAAALGLAQRLTDVQASLALVSHPALADRWPHALAALATAGDRLPATPGEERRVHGVVRGRATRLLVDARRWTPDDGELRLSRALGGGVPPAEGAAFVEGFLGASGEVLVHDPGLLGIVDRWLARLSAGAFDDVVALLRRTFGGFAAGERRRIGEIVARRGDGRIAAPFGWDLDPGRVERATATVHQLLGVR